MNHLLPGPVIQFPHYDFRMGCDPLVIRKGGHTPLWNHSKRWGNLLLSHQFFFSFFDSPPQVIEQSLFLFPFSGGGKEAETQLFALFFFLLLLRKQALIENYGSFRTLRKSEGINICLFTTFHCQAGLYDEYSVRRNAAPGFPGGFAVSPATKSLRAAGDTQRRQKKSTDKGLIGISREGQYLLLRLPLSVCSRATDIYLFLHPVNWKLRCFWICRLPYKNTYSLAPFWAL